MADGTGQEAGVFVPWESDTVTAEDAIEAPLGRLLCEYIRTCKEAGKKRRRLKRLKAPLTAKEKALKTKLMKQFETRTS